MNVERRGIDVKSLLGYVSIEYLLKSLSEHLNLFFSFQSETNIFLYCHLSVFFFQESYCHYRTFTCFNSCEK